MITSVSKGVFIVLIFCFIFYFFFLIYRFGTGRVGQVLEGRLVGSTKNGNKRKREGKKKKEGKTPKSLAVGERMDEHDF